jgi:hypothetical protein
MEDGSSAKSAEVRSMSWYLCHTRAITTSSDVAQYVMPLVTLQALTSTSATVLHFQAALKRLELCSDQLRKAPPFIPGKKPHVR